MNKGMEDDKILVIEDADGNLTIEWQDDHPFASIFNTWAEEDWIEAMRLGDERAKELSRGE